MSEFNLSTHASQNVHDRLVSLAGMCVKPCYRNGFFLVCQYACRQEKGRARPVTPDEKRLGGRVAQCRRRSNALQGKGGKVSLHGNCQGSQRVYRHVDVGSGLHTPRDVYRALPLQKRQGKEQAADKLRGHAAVQRILPRRDPAAYRQRIRSHRRELGPVSYQFLIKRGEWPLGQASVADQ